VPVGVEINPHAGMGDATVKLGKIGAIDGLRLVDPRTLELSLLATSEAGEFLIDSLKTGRANIRMSFQKKPSPLEKQRLILAIIWLDEVYENTWIAHLGMSNELTGIA